MFMLIEIIRIWDRYMHDQISLANYDISKYHIDISGRGDINLWSTIPTFVFYWKPNNRIKFMANETFID